MTSTGLFSKAKATKTRFPQYIIAFLALILSTMQVVGCNLSLEHGTSVHSHIGPFLGLIPSWMWVVIWLVEILAFYFVLRFLFRALNRNSETTYTRCQIKKPILIFIIGALGMLICWLPILLANLPGFFNYDISGQLIQVMYADLNDFSTHHSLTSTLVMGGIITLGYKLFDSLFAGILLYSCFQMVLCSLTFAYSLYFIYKKTQRTWLVVAGFLFYALSPTISMFTTSTTKDVICSLLVLVATLLTFDMLEDPDAFFGGPAKPIYLAMALVFASLFRKNIIYAVILFAIMYLCFLASKRKAVAILFVATLIGYFGISLALEKGLDAVPGGAAEAFSIPIQQIGYLYVSEGEDAFTPEELNLLYNMMPEGQWSKYSPFISDSLKNYLYTDYFNEHKGEFLSLWVKKFLQYPAQYIKAFFNLTYQAWYPGTSIYDGDIYYFDFYGGNYRIEKTTYIPVLTDFCEKISLGFSYQKVPVLRLLFSLGFMFWVMLTTLAYGLYTKRKMIWGATLLAFCVSLTCLAGPISLVRYYLILFYAFPVFLALFFYKQKPTNL